MHPHVLRLRLCWLAPTHAHATECAVRSSPPRPLPRAGLYAAVLPPGGGVLELCASAHSHLPAGLQLASCVGTGMNVDELGANAALTRWWVQDLNEQWKLEGQDDGAYDAVLCVNGLQYLTQPEAVLSEVRGGRGAHAHGLRSACNASLHHWVLHMRVHMQRPRAPLPPRVCRRRHACVCAGVPSAAAARAARDCVWRPLLPRKGGWGSAVSWQVAAAGVRWHAGHAGDRRVTLPLCAWAAMRPHGRRHGQAG